MGKSDRPRRTAEAVLLNAAADNRQRNDDLQHQLDTILTAYSAAPIPVMPLKGAAEFVYGVWSDPAARAMTDIDLLVPSEMLAQSLTILGELDYRQTAPADDSTDHHHAIPYQLPGHPGSVEVHHQVMTQRHRNVLRSERMWNESNPVEWRGRQVTVPSATLLAYHTVVHGWLSDDAHRQRRLSLRPAFHLRAIEENLGPIDWDNIRRALKATGHASVISDVDATLGLFDPARSLDQRARRRQRLLLAVIDHDRVRHTIERVNWMANIVDADTLRSRAHLRGTDRQVRAAFVRGIARRAVRRRPRSTEGR